MFAGPIIAREVLTTPRPPLHYVTRASYAGLLFILMWTAWQSLIGWQDVDEVGIMARFGAILFVFFALVQLSLILFFAPLAAATAVAHEKDRRTFLLLLMTDLSDVEIVLGKLVASLLQVATLLAAGAPVLLACVLLGGVSPAQVGEVLAVTAAAGLACGSLGLVVALWRDRTFQSLALTVLVVALGLIAFEASAMAFPDLRVLGVPLASALDPYRATLAILSPESGRVDLLGVPGLAFVAFALVASLALNVLAVVKLRVWNPGRNEPREQREAGAVAEGLVESQVEIAEVPREELVAVGASVAGGTPPAPAGPTGPAAAAGRGPIRRRPTGPRACMSRGGLTGASPARPGTTDVRGPIPSPGES